MNTVIRGLATVLLVIVLAVGAAWALRQIPAPDHSAASAASPGGHVIVQAANIPKPKAQAEAPQSILPFNEIDAVMLCGYNAERRMRNPDSYDEKWGWHLLRHPEKGRYTIVRDFTGENAFGGTVAQHYVCLLDSHGQAIELTIHEGYGADDIKALYDFTRARGIR